MGLFTLITGNKQMKAEQEMMRQQIEAEQRRYEQQIQEQRNASILEARNISDNIATINVGGSDTYADDPMNRRKRTMQPNFNSSQLGIY